MDELKEKTIQVSAAVEPGGAARVVAPRGVLCRAAAAMEELKGETVQVSAAVEPD